MFAKKSFLEATVEDIIQQAQVSRGTFYIYFHNKMDIFLNLVREFLEEMTIEMEASWHSPDPAVTVEATVSGFLRAVSRRRDIIKVLFEVSHYNTDIAKERANLRERLRAKIRSHLLVARTAGLAQDLDLDIAASALGGMLEHQAYLICSVDTGQNLEDVMVTVATLWRHAVFLRPKLP